MQISADENSKEAHTQKTKVSKKNSDSRKRLKTKGIRKVGTVDKPIIAKSATQQLGHAEICLQTPNIADAPQQVENPEHFLHTSKDSSGDASELSPTSTQLTNSGLQNQTDTSDFSESVTSENSYSQISVESPEGIVSEIENRYVTQGQPFPIISHLNHCDPSQQQQTDTPLEDAFPLRKKAKRKRAFKLKLRPPEVTHK